jgi:hypothetical protein
MLKSRSLRPRRGTTTVSKVTRELGLNGAVFKASDDEQRTAGRHIIGMLACYEEILEKNKVFFSSQFNA